MKSASIQQTIKHWLYIEPYANAPKSESEYEKLLEFVDELMALSRHKKDERVTSLIKLIAQNIASYEANKFSSQPTSPVDVLRFLMEEHNLTQSDLPEIGSQSLVSKILRGERHLTSEHIRKLSHRFGVSPAIFY